METSTTPICTTIKVGEESTPQGVTQIPPAPVAVPVHIHHGPPPHVHQFMKRKLRQGCCCLAFLILVNLIIVINVAKKVTKLSDLLSPNSEVMFMPGGFKPFCSDLCINMCPDYNNNNNDDNEINFETDSNMGMNNNDLPIQDTMDINVQISGFSCELKSCLNSCSHYFEVNNYENNYHHHEHHQDHEHHEHHEHRGHHHGHYKHHSSSDSSEDGNNDTNGNDDDSSENKKEVYHTNRYRDMNRNQIIY